MVPIEIGPPENVRAFFMYQRTTPPYRQKGTLLEAGFSERASLVPQLLVGNSVFGAE